MKSAARRGSPVREPESPEPDALFRDRPLAAVALIVAATWLAFGAQLGYELTDVDVQPLIQTGRLRSVAELQAVLTEPLMQGRMPNALYWRPVTSLSYGVDELVWGLEPFGYHLTDLLLHLATGLALFGLVRGLWSALGREGGDAIALLAALVFVLHPAHVETVPAIARRGDVLVGLFLVLTLRAVMASFRSTSMAPRLRALAFCALGALSKETGFAIPIVALLLAVACHPTRGVLGRLRGLRLALPLALASAAVFALRALVLSDVGGAEPETQGPIAWRAPHSLWLHVQGLLLPAFPDALTFPRAGQLPGFASRHPLAVAAALAALALAGLWTWRVARKLRGSPSSRDAARLLAFLLGGLTTLYLVHVQVLFHPRYLYSAAVFFAVLLAWGLWESARALRDAGPTARAVPALAAVALGALTLSLTAASPLVDKRGMEEWRRSAELAQHVLDLVDARVADLPAGTRIYLVDFPYRLDGPFLPWSVMLLEHSVQGWLDLRFPAKHFDAVGLSYAVIGASEAGVEVEADPSRHVHVRARGALSGTSFPWSSQYGKGYEGTLYRYVGPHRGRELDIELPGEDASDPLFLVWTVDRVELVRGWTWRVASAGSGAADGEPTSR